MIVIAPHSTRAACYTILLTSNTKRQAFFMVRGQIEIHLLEFSVLPVTSYSLITIRVSACIFPNFRQWRKDFTAIKFSRECRKFFINHINCLNSEKKPKSKFHFICTWINALNVTCELMVMLKQGIYKKNWILSILTYFQQLIQDEKEIPERHLLTG